MTTVSLPATLDAFTPEWLTAALRERGAVSDATVTSVSAEPVGQGAGLLCQLGRLTLGYAGEPAGAPRTLVVKIPTADEQTRGMVSVFRFYEREVRFYDELAARVALPTARCYYSAHDAASGDFVLLLEDLAAARLGDQLAGCPLADAELAVSELAALHAAWWEHPHLDALHWMPAAEDPINKAGLALYPMAWPVFVERFGHDLPAPMLAVGERLGAQAGAILDRFQGRPRTICHGDFRLDNLFFGDGTGRPPLTVVDWQIAIRSTGTYDIGYFMSQSVGPDVRRAHEMDLLRRYHGILTERGVTGYSFDQCLEDYRWTLLFCFCYPVMGGGLGDLANERGYALARAMMERSAAAITDWDAGELLEG